MAYLFAFLQTDGSYWKGGKNKGRITVELSAVDLDILQQFQRIVPYKSSIRFRSRRTNFAEEHATAIWSLHTGAARHALEALGLPSGRKAATVRPPDIPVSEPDYVRGLVDADGSVGFTARGYPFISFTTLSPALNAYFCDKVHEVTGVQRTVNPNKRDGIYNPLLTSEPAVEFTRWLYYEGCLALERKRARAREVAQWTRPEGMRRRTTRKRWTPEEDAVALNSTIKEGARLLGRTEQSVQLRRWRLRQAQEGRGGRTPLS
ncbi:hypothetical protein [Actinomadura hibisca]|uniref:hypothetical protein n=1 Tax=Actinomadura hibisca TaxID=68565 RepID=UPI00082BDF02|nr:hypothetical protein [Actinomadura hibisca]